MPQAKSLKIYFIFHEDQILTFYLLIFFISIMQSFIPNHQ